jgi:signal transduction histidine kinase
MRKSASNLHEMLENLLEWACMQRGITSFDPSEFMLKHKITESLKLVSETALQKNITIRLEIQDDVKIYSDPNMFDTIIRNLASNAIKFTPKGGVVTISSRRTKDNLVEVAVKDTGIGMSEDIRSNLFHVDKNTNRKGTQGELSTGLGLILCKDFIEKQGGKIWMNSEEGKGSTFYFTTPGVDGSSEKN